MSASSDSHDDWMQAAVDAAAAGMADGRGGPFGAVVVREGRIVAAGANRVVRDHDPTAHAEVCAIRSACEALGSHSLRGCDIYATCEPCPMCLAAIYWARIDRIYFAATREDARRAGFDDAAVYREVAAPLDAREIPILRLESEAGLSLFERWMSMQDKVPY